MGGDTEIIAEEGGRNTYNPTWDGSRAVTGMKLELLADFFRTLKELRRKLEPEAKDYRKTGELGMSSRITKKPTFLLQTGKNVL